MQGFHIIKCNDIQNMDAYALVNKYYYCYAPV